MSNLRIEKAQQYLRDHGIDLWLIVTAEGKDIHSPFLLGARCFGRHAIIIPKDGSSVAICTLMEAPMARKAKQIEEILPYKKSEEFIEKLREIVYKISKKPVIALNYVENLYKEGGEAINTLTHGDYLALRKIFPDATFVSAQGLLENLRTIKTPEDVKLHEKAVEIALGAMEKAVELIKPGVTESEVAAEAEHFMRKRGATPSFPIIVASGPNSADPHHETGERKIQEGDLVIIDLGAEYKLRVSDITWTVYVGEKPPKLFQRMFNVTLEAQRKAINAIGPGVEAWKIDKVARDIILKHGFKEEEFPHSTGHPIGIDVHDIGPLLGEKGKSKRAEMKLLPGMIVTVEPGIYIQGKGGVRIEDDVLVTEKGHRVLSRTPDELICI
ncbi:MAG: aminopeptidase P family protein [Candidatus Odinarchaeota archaeon]|nr:aminopeptidase P family protein [Candidatus Odinarchaeota archaeon]